MNRLFLAAFLAVAASCGGEVVDATESAETLDGLQAVDCNPRDPAGCDRGESCLTVLQGTRGEAHVCSASRCTGPRDCRDGYACRLSHCIALERSRPDERPDLRRRPVEPARRPLDPARLPVR